MNWFKRRGRANWEVAEIPLWVDLVATVVGLALLLVVLLFDRIDDPPDADAVSAPASQSPDDRPKPN